MRWHERSRRRTLTLLGSFGTATLAGCTLGVEADPSFDHPGQVHVDEPFEMRIEDVPDGDPLELVLEGGDGTGDRFGAAVELEVDGDPVDVNDAAVVGGDVPADLEVPTTVALLQFADVSWWEFHYGGRRRQGSFEWPDERTLRFVLRNPAGDELGSTSVRRQYPAVESVEPDGDLVGTAFEPERNGEASGIVVLHGSDGERWDHVAALLARHGYTALALEYFDGPGLPDDLVEIPLEYVERAIDWVLDRDRVTGDRAGLWGVSKGGELALLAGSRLDSVGPVVSIAGSGLVWEGGASADDLPETSSWSIGGDPVSYLTLSDVDWEPGPNSPVVELFADALEVADGAAIDEATIPVEEIEGPVLLVSGGDDRLWPAERLQNVAVARLESADHPSHRHLVYEDAGHGIFQPYFPLEETYGRGYGGTLAASAEAAHDHWPDVLTAFSALDVPAR